MSVSPSTVATDPLSLPEVKAFVRKVTKRKSKTVRSAELKDLSASLGFTLDDDRRVVEALQGKSVALDVDPEDRSWAGERVSDGSTAPSDAEAEAEPSAKAKKSSRKSPSKSGKAAASRAKADGKGGRSSKAAAEADGEPADASDDLSLIHISEPTRH